MSIGKKNWVFPDADLPPAGTSLLKGHESLIILNTSEEKAIITLQLYFTDREPVFLKPFEVDGNRVRYIRLDNKNEIGYEIPIETQYAIRLESDTPVVVQYGRLDARQKNLAYYTTMGYSF